MNKLIDKILTEWSYRVYDGMPNIKNPVHLIELKNSLKHLKINEDAIDYLMNRLYENEGEKLVKNPNPGTQRKNMVTLAYAKTFYKDKGVNVDDMSDDQIAKMADTDSKKGTPDDTEKTDDKKLKELEVTDEQASKEAEKNQINQEMLGLILSPRQDRKGFGVNKLSRRDAIAFAEYLEETNTPAGMKAFLDRERQRRRELEKQNGPVTDETVDEVIEKMTPKAEDYPKGTDDPQYKLDKKQADATKKKIMCKGGPPAAECKGEKGEKRFRALVKLYIQTGGRCPITKEKIALQDMELDHVVSLDNGGKDEPDNWMFTKANINQFKGSKSNPAIQADLQVELAKTPEERASEKADAELKNFEKKETREYWKKKYDDEPGFKFTRKQLNSMSKDELDACAVGYNEHIQAREDLTPEQKKARYIKRNATRKVEVTLNKNGKKLKKKISYTRGEGVVLPDRKHKETWGLYVDPDTGETKINPKYSGSYDAAHAWYESSRGSGGQKLTTEDQIDEMDKGGIVTDAHSDRKANAAADKAIEEQTTRKRTADYKQMKTKATQAKTDVKTSTRAAEKDLSSNQKSVVNKQLKEWDEKNPIPDEYEETEYIDNPNAGPPYEPKISSMPKREEYVDEKAEGKEKREQIRNYNEAMYDWDRNKRKEEEKARNIDANGQPLKQKKITKHKIPKDKKGNVTSKGKKSKGYKDWLEKRNEKRYYLMRQEYYQRKYDKKKNYKESVE